MLQWSMMMEGDEVVGLDVGEQSVSAVQLRFRSSGHWEVRNAVVLELARGATHQDVAHVIRTLWRQNHMTCTLVCSCLRSPSLLVRHFRYPHLTDEELRSALRLTAEEELQMPADQFHLDWHLFGRAEGPASRPSAEQIEGFLVAVPKKEAQRHLDLLEAAGLHPVILDVGCTTIANLYMTLREVTQTGEAVCLMNLQEHCVDLAILNGHGFLYPCSIYSATQTWGQTPDSLVENIRNELKYFQFRLLQHPVQKVVLMGPASRDQPLTEHLQKTLALPVEHWDPLQDQRFHVARAARAAWNDAVHGPLSAISLGLALRSG